MIQKTKLGVWDFFAYILSGYAVVLSIVIHLVVLKIITVAQIMKLPSALLIIVGLLLFLLIGMLFEPIANLFSKPLIIIKNDNDNKLSFWQKNKTNWEKEWSLKMWDKNIECMKNKALDISSLKTNDNIYQFCKNWIIQHGDSEQFNSFLGKYGFYRNIYFLLIININVCWLVYPTSWRLTSIFLTLSLLLFIYWYRSKVFFRHMSVTVYNQFVALHDAPHTEGNDE